MHRGQRNRGIHMRKQFNPAARVLPDHSHWKPGWIHTQHQQPLLPPVIARVNTRKLLACGKMDKAFRREILAPKASGALGLSPVRRRRQSIDEFHDRNRPQETRGTAIKSIPVHWFGGMLAKPEFEDFLCFEFQLNTPRVHRRTARTRTAGPVVHHHPLECGGFGGPGG